jgi:signal transduction histidine kinase
MNYVAALPIRIRGKIAGAFQVYAPQAEFFDENEVRLLTQVSDDISFALTAIADQTERKRLEAEVIEISSREQRRIGQDLHDDLCQCLAGTEFSASALAKDLEAKSSPDAARALKIAESMRQSLGRARILARGLAPAVIEAEGLAGALRELAANSAEMFHIRCHYEGPENVQVRGNAEGLHLYRIAQEAISNAVRHGRASEVCLRLQSRDGHTLMQIQDNGIGIPQPLPLTPGMGLGTMRYRAEMVGGILDIRPGAEGGTEILCKFPILP